MFDVRCATDSPYLSFNRIQCATPSMPPMSLRPRAAYGRLFLLFVSCPFIGTYNFTCCGSSFSRRTLKLLIVGVSLQQILRRSNKAPVTDRILSKSILLPSGLSNLR